MNNFSDLQMETINLTLTANYHINEKLLLNVSANYNKFNDEEYYIYDGDGSTFYLGMGLQYNF